MDHHPDYNKYVKPAFLDKPPDNAVMSAIYREYLPKVVHFLRGKGEKDQAVSEDVFQEALTVLFLNSRKANFTLSAPLKSYLFGISIRIWYKRKRVDGKDSYPGEITPNVTSEEDLAFIDEATDLHLAEIENRKRFEKAFKLSSSACQLIIELRLEGLSYREIIEQYPKYGNEAAARQKYRRCLKNLNDNLKSN